MTPTMYQPRLVRSCRSNPVRIRISVMQGKERSAAGNAIMTILDRFAPSRYEIGKTTNITMPTSAIVRIASSKMMAFISISSFEFVTKTSSSDKSYLRQFLNASRTQLPILHNWLLFSHTYLVRKIVTYKIAKGNHQPRKLLPHLNSTTGPPFHSNSSMLLRHQSILRNNFYFPRETSSSTCWTSLISPITFLSRTILYALRLSTIPESRSILIITFSG
jgi:hypothetical protein